MATHEPLAAFAGMDHRMTGPEFKAIRHRLGLTQSQFALALAHSAETGNVNVCQMETGSKPIPDDTARLAEALDRLGRKKIPNRWLKGVDKS
jgi:DNA-binding transcriptional regulator YiaG